MTPPKPKCKHEAPKRYLLMDKGEPDWRCGTCGRPIVIISKKEFHAMKRLCAKKEKKK